MIASDGGRGCLQRVVNHRNTRSELLHVLETSKVVLVADSSLCVAMRKSDSAGETIRQLQHVQITMSQDFEMCRTKATSTARRKFIMDCWKAPASFCVKDCFLATFALYCICSTTPIRTPYYARLLIVSPLGYRREIIVCTKGLRKSSSPATGHRARHCKRP